VKCTRAESTGVGKMLKQLVVNETKCPIRRKRSIHHFEVRAPRHIKTDLKFRWAIFVGHNRSRKDFDLRDENLARCKHSVCFKRQKKLSIRTFAQVYIPHPHRLPNRTHSIISCSEIPPQSARYVPILIIST
jgi:hypothetical protein